MNTTLENFLWFAAGIAAVAGIWLAVKATKKGSEKGPELLERETATGGTGKGNAPLPTSGMSAKEAFISNIDRFSPILSQLNSKVNIETWSEQIVDINNPQLTELWKRCTNNIAMWKQILSSWGLRQDTCQTFTYLPKYAKMYQTSDNSTPVVDSKYRVIEGCWIFTDDSTGNKRVVKKGIIEKI